MVRPFRSETVRYGEYSKSGEFIYDRPFLWGSKRTGPDLARVGGKYPDLWHYRHMLNPRDLVGLSIMPSYPWLASKYTDFYSLRKKLSVMKYLGVPYSDEEVGNADADAEKAAKVIADGLRNQGVVDDRLEQREVVALIAYLQSLGHKSGGAAQAAVPAEGNETETVSTGGAGASGSSAGKARSQ